MRSAPVWAWINLDGLAYGAGLEYMFDPLNGLRTEYTANNFGEEDDVEIGTADTVSLSFVRRF